MGVPRALAQIAAPSLSLEDTQPKVLLILETFVLSCLPLCLQQQQHYEYLPVLPADACVRYYMRVGISLLPTGRAACGPWWEVFCLT